MKAVLVADRLRVSADQFSGDNSTYVLWFRGVARIAPAVVASIGFLSPLTAVLLGWVILGQNLTLLQITGMAIVLGSIWVCQRAMRPGPSSTSTARS